MFYNYFKIAYRNLFKNRVFSTINIIGLSIGMSAALLISIWVQNELTFDNYHKDADRIYRMISHMDVGQQIWNVGTVPLPLMKAAVEEIPEIESLVKVRPILGGAILKTEQGELFSEKKMAYVDEDWLELFEYEVLEGDLSTFAKSVHSIAMTASKAKQIFGYELATGQMLTMDSVIYSVDVILKDNPTNSVLQFQTFIPLRARHIEGKNLKNDLSWGDFSYHAFVKCKKGVNPTTVEEKLLAILDTNRSTKTEKNNTTIGLEAIQAIRFSTGVDNDNYSTQNESVVYIFALIALLLLFSACFNYVNLSTAVINKRVKEIGIKKVIGASFQHIFSQVMVETFLINALAIIFSLGIAQFCLPFLQEITGLSLNIDLNNPQLWLLLGGMFVLSIAVAGIYPAILFGGFKPIRLIKGKLLTQEGISLRKGLVVAQFVGAIAMLLSTVVIYQQLKFIQQTNVGYDRSYVLDISPQLFKGDWKANFKKFDVFFQELKTIPEFEELAQSSGSLVNIKSSNAGGFKWEGQIEGANTSVFRLNADEELLTVFDLKMADGRWFEEGMETDKNNYLINESATRTFNIPTPIVGQTVSFGKKEGQIIGIVKDFHFNRMDKAIDPLLISYNNEFKTTILAKVNAQTGQNALKKAATKFAAHFPQIPFKYTFLDDTFEKMHEGEAKMTLLFQIFAFLLTVISCLGLFGLATFAVERRTKEIGIRKVLGANSQLIVQLIAKDFIRLVVIALLIAIPLSWFSMQQWLANYTYRVDMEWWMFIIVGVLTIGVAFMTVSIQSIRAALTNPTESLRNE